MSAEQDHGFFYPLIFPYKQKKWFAKTWWLIILTMIPIFDFVLLRGWRLILVRNMSKGEEEILPEPSIAAMIKYGLVLWLMTTFYVIIPTIIIFSVGAGELGNLFSALSCLWSSIFGSSDDPSLYMCLKSEAGEMVLRIIIEIIWLMVSGTLYRVAMIRYAITDKKRVFLSLPINAFLALRYIKSFIMMWVFGVLLVAALTLISMIFSATIVLTPFIPLVVLLVYYYSTGYEYGHLAHQMANTTNQK